jgi:Uma2 family endonuclease
MTTAVAAPTVTEPRVRKWTKAEYYQMADLGWFRGQRAELIEGEIVVQSPQNWPHSVTTDRVGERLRQAFGATAWVRTQLPLDVSSVSEPEPDVSVVLGRRDDYNAHPSSAILVVEVSDSTLWFDRNEKASFYAANGIHDYWIVDLVHRRLEVRRAPKPDASTKFGHTYADLTVLGRHETVIPLALPSVSIPVADFFG